MPDLPPDPLLPGGRRPAPGWQQRCSADPVTVLRRWNPGDNIGIVCCASGVVGIDLDRHAGGPDGIAAFAVLCAAHGQPWPDTLTIRTPHDGRHVYFRVSLGCTIVSTSGGRVGPGIDTRGPGRHSGGYLVGPGSVVDGRTYVIERDTAIRELPAWLADMLAS